MLYKIMILYMLKCSNIKLSSADISDFLVMSGYADAFSFQFNLNELESDGFITVEKKHNRSYISLTEEGSKTVDSLESKLSKEIKLDIYNHIADNKSSIMASHKVETSVSETEDGTYIARLICKGKGDAALYDISLSFPTRILAETACDNFMNNSTDIYRFIVDKLMN